MKTLLYISLIFFTGCKTQKKIISQESVESTPEKNLDKIDDLQKFRSNVYRNLEVVAYPKSQVSKKQKIDPAAVIDHTREIDLLVEQEINSRTSSQEKIPCWQVVFKCGTNRNKKLAELATQWIYNNRDKFYEGELNIQRKFDNGGYVIIIREFTEELEAKVFQYKISKIPGKPRVYLSRRIVYLDIDSYRETFLPEKDLHIEKEGATLLTKEKS